MMCMYIHMYMIVVSYMYSGYELTKCEAYEMSDIHVYMFWYFCNDFMHTISVDNLAKNGLKC